MPVQNLPQRLKAGDFFQPFHDPVEIQVGIRRDAGYGSEHCPLHVAKQLAALDRADRTIGKVKVAEELLRIEEYIEGLGWDALQRAYHPLEGRPVVFQQLVQRSTDPSGDG